jgi:hypothetical protein
MSLKVFHVFFITVSVLLCVGFGWWCFVAVTGPAFRAAGALSFLAALALVVYEIFFLRKMRNLK